VFVSSQWLWSGHTTSFSCLAASRLTKADRLWSRYQLIARLLAVLRHIPDALSHVEPCGQQCKPSPQQTPCTNEITQMSIRNHYYMTQYTHNNPYFASISLLFSKEQRGWSFIRISAAYVVIHFSGLASVFFDLWLDVTDKPIHRQSQTTRLNRRWPMQSQSIVYN